MTYWINTVSRGHVQRGVAGGFTQANHGKPHMLRRMARGDWIVFYSPKTDYPDGAPLQAFTAIGQVADDEVYQADLDPRVPALAAQGRVPAVHRDADPAAARRPRLHRGQGALGLPIPVRGLQDRRARLRGHPRRDDGLTATRSYCGVVSNTEARARRSRLRCFAIRRCAASARRPARRSAGDARASDAAAARALADRCVVLRRPLRPARRRRRPRHGRPAASAHRPADGQLAVQRRDRAPRQRGRARHGPARRAQPDDRGRGHLPLRGVDARRPPLLHGVQLWVALPDADRDTARDFAHYVPPRRTRGRRAGPGLPRRTRRRPLPGARRSPRCSARRSTSRPGATVTLDVDPELRARRAARPGPASTAAATALERRRPLVPVARPRRRSCSPTAATVRPACSSSADRRSPSSSSCGGTSSDAATTTSSTTATCGRPHDDRFGSVDRLSRRATARPSPADGTLRARRNP